MIYIYADLLELKIYSIFFILHSSSTQLKYYTSTFRKGRAKSRGRTDAQTDKELTHQKKTRKPFGYIKGLHNTYLLCVSSKRI